MLGHGHPHAQQEVVTHGLAHRLKDHPPETHSILQRAAILVCAMIGRGRPELINQMS